MDHIISTSNLGQDRTVGVSIEVTIAGINGDKPIKAKVDTGADMSCLHGTNIKVQTDPNTKESSVTFQFGEYKYRMGVAGFMSVASADGGTTNRPIIRTNARINDQLIKDVQFNLNDRSDMDYQLLVGVNLIKAAKLTVDPSMSEDVEITFGSGGIQSTRDVEGPIDNPTYPDETGNTSESRSDSGVTTGLIDSLIYISRVLRGRDLTHPEVVEALKELSQDEDLAHILSQSTSEATPFQPNDTVPQRTLQTQTPDDANKISVPN